MCVTCVASGRARKRSIVWRTFLCTFSFKKKEKKKNPPQRKSTRLLHNDTEIATSAVRETRHCAVNEYAV